MSCTSHEKYNQAQEQCFEFNVPMTLHDDILKALQADKSPWQNASNVIEQVLGAHLKKHSLEAFREEAYAFQSKTFGRPSYTAPLHHMKEEVEEAIESGAEEEFADILLLLCNAYALRFPEKTGADLLKAGRAKLEKLKKRQWQKPDSNGVIRHIKGTAD